MTRTDLTRTEIADTRCSQHSGSEHAPGAARSTECRVTRGEPDRDHRRDSGRGAAGVARIGVMLLAATVGIALPVALSGCNTTRAAGEDLESLGENISDEAEDAGGD